MHFISVILFALSANMDNVPLGIAYGMRGIGISFSRNLLIAFITSLGTLLSMTLGSFITVFISTQAATIIGCTILILIGLWFLIKPLCCRRKAHAQKEDTAEETSLQNIGIKESIALALALMVNNMGFGIGAEIAGLPILLTTVCTFLCSMFLLVFGVQIGKRFGNSLLGKYTEPLSGVFIVILGIYEFFI